MSAVIDTVMSVIDFSIEMLPIIDLFMPRSQSEASSSTEEWKKAKVRVLNTFSWWNHAVFSPTSLSLKMWPLCHQRAFHRSSMRAWQIGPRTCQVFELRLVILILFLPDNCHFLLYPMMLLHLAFLFNETLQPNFRL